MIEKVLSPESGQLAVHTPLLVEKGSDVYLFYAKCDYPPGEKSLRFRKRYEIFVSVSKGGKSWKQAKKPVLTDPKYSLCRPWVMKEGSQYRMYFVKNIGPVKFRICTATSKDLKKWTVEEDPLFGAFDGVEDLASPCVLKVGSKYRLYFTGAHMPKEDSVFVAEGTTGKKFNVDKKPKYKPKKGTKYDRSCYVPFVFKNGSKWKMLFAGTGDDGRHRTFLAEGDDGLAFGDGKLVIDLEGDARFARGAYKAVLFGDDVYFVGLEADGRGTIYRAPKTDFGI